MDDPSQQAVSSVTSSKRGLGGWCENEGSSLWLIVPADGAGVEKPACAIRQVVFAVDMTEDHDIARNASKQAIEVAAARTSRGLVIGPLASPGARNG